MPIKSYMILLYWTTLLFCEMVISAPEGLWGTRDLKSIRRGVINKKKRCQNSKTVLSTSLWVFWRICFVWLLNILFYNFKHHFTTMVNILTVIVLINQFHITFSFLQINFCLPSFKCVPNFTFFWWRFFTTNNLK